ncbi:hypothetical protein [Alicyclobacillus hesperidum]|nr:hypothetical protein [Alicyclobacillus hesperidum]
MREWYRLPLRVVAVYLCLGEASAFNWLRDATDQSVGSSIRTLDQHGRA